MSQGDQSHGLACIGKYTSAMPHLAFMPLVRIFSGWKVGDLRGVWILDGLGGKTCMCCGKKHQ